MNMSIFKTVIFSPYKGSEVPLYFRLFKHVLSEQLILDVKKKKKENGKFPLLDEFEC